MLFFSVSFDEATISIIVERLGKVIISSTLQQTHRSPIPPTSFAYFTAQMYEGVVAQRVPQLTTIAFDMTTTEEVMNAAIWPVLAAGGEVLEDDILVINTERYTWLPCTDEEANDLKPDFAVVHRAFFQPVPDAGERTGRVHEWFVDQVLAVDEGKTTPLNGESKGRLLRYLHHLRIAGMREVKGLLFNGTDMHYVWMDSDNIGRVTESKWTADSASLLRSWSVPYRYPPLTEAIIKLCSQLGLRIHTGTTGAVLGKGLCGSCGWRTGAS